MKKSKKMMIILLITAGLCAAAGTVIFVSRVPREKREIVMDKARTFVEERGGEVVTEGVAYAVVVISALSPLMTRIKRSSGRFETAASSVRENEKQTKAAIAAMEESMEKSEARNEERMQRLEQMFSECVAHMNEDHAAVERTREDAERIIAMVDVGLCHMPEIVASGNGMKIDAIARGALPPSSVLERGDEANVEAETR